MPVRVSYSSKGVGNTVPYAPLEDAVRRNHGFVDLRGRPDMVANVPEASESEALGLLLRRLADPASLLASLGCDLGERSARSGRAETRRIAGGYVQVADAKLRDDAPSLLQRTCRHFEEALRSAVEGDRWRVDFNLRAVAYEFDPPIRAHAVWIWFEAGASSGAGAVASRERLLGCLADAVPRLPTS